MRRAKALQFIKNNKFKIGLTVGAALCAWAYYDQTHAADLGAQQALPDLEERIAELEATTARKGNRKVSLEISGVVNKAVMGWDALGDKDAAFIENGADETRFKMSGEAKFRPGFSAVYAISVGQGKAGFKVDPYTGFGVGTDNDLYTREAYVGLKNDTFGTLTIGLQGGATDDLVKPSVASTDAANKRLTLGSGINYLLIGMVPGSYFALELEPFNGRKADAVKYVSPTLGGFSASAAWFSDDSWDAALNFSGSTQGFTLLAGVGYAVDKADPLFGILGADEVKRFTANGGVKHDPSGLFVQGSYGTIEINDEDTNAWHLQAGVERRFSEALPGPLAIYAEYADWQDLNLNFYGVGLNQKFGTEVDLYLVARRYEIGDEDVDTIMSGLRLKF
jgi:predicted porin